MQVACWAQCLPLAVIRQELRSGSVQLKLSKKEPRAGAQYQME
jgi:hypothetical protein